jgi:bifunctional DNA-binding transcriptional regulator/antitoxin component of YhaV-PrlF toxin-antitoxin module
MSTFHIRVVKGAKIVIPATLRRKYGFDIGTTLVVDDCPGGVMIRSLDDAVATAQAIMARIAPADRRLSDEVIAERRAQSMHE